MQTLEKSSPAAVRRSRSPRSFGSQVSHKAAVILKHFFESCAVQSGCYARYHPAVHVSGWTVGPWVDHGGSGFNVCVYAVVCFLPGLLLLLLLLQCRHELSRQEKRIDSPMLLLLLMFLL